MNSSIGNHHTKSFLHKLPDSISVILIYVHYNMKYNEHVIAIILSVISGTGYYIMMEQSISTEANCSYLATPMTDFLAFLLGFIVIGYGFKYNNHILTFLGATVIVEHIWQLNRKGIKEYRKQN
jgi:hypothetical protein